MKRLYPFLLLPALICLFSTVANGQSQRLQLFEYFDNTSIPPFGAAANAYFDSIAAANTANMTVIKYHVYFGSSNNTDPMNLENPTQVETRLSYYNLGFDPIGYQDGGDSLDHTFNGAEPDTFSRSYINLRDTVASPYTITVTHQLNAAGDSIQVHTVITQTDTFTGVPYAYVVVIEKLIHFIDARVLAAILISGM